MSFSLAVERLFFSESEARNLLWLLLESTLRLRRRKSAQRIPLWSPESFQRGQISLPLVLLQLEPFHDVTSSRGSDPTLCRERYVVGAGSCRWNSREGMDIELKEDGKLKKEGRRCWWRRVSIEKCWFEGLARELESLHQSNSASLFSSSSSLFTKKYLTFLSYTKLPHYHTPNNSNNMPVSNN